MICGHCKSVVPMLQIAARDWRCEGCGRRHRMIVADGDVKGCLRCAELEAENAELRSGIGTLLAASNKLARQVLAFTRGDPVPVEAPALGVRLELAEEDGA